ncbi:hypothetical protein Pmar_PMAR015173, partial [Perkinsus marinus ATCC 50983]
MRVVYHPIPVSRIAKVRGYASRKVRERRYEKSIESGLGLGPELRVLDTLLTMFWIARTTVQTVAEAHSASEAPNKKSELAVTKRVTTSCDIDPLSDDFMQVLH